MIWVHSELGASGLWAHDSSIVTTATEPDESEESGVFFTLSHQTLQQSSFDKAWLAEVPSTNPGSNILLRQAMRYTANSLAAKGATIWRDKLSECKYPSLCKLSMDGTLPMELVHTSETPGFPTICAWAIWYGFLESPVACTQ